MIVQATPWRRVTLYSVAHSLISYYCHVPLTRREQDQGRTRTENKREKEKSTELQEPRTKRVESIGEERQRKKDSFTNAVYSLVLVFLHACTYSESARSCEMNRNVSTRSHISLLFCRELVASSFTLYQLAVYMYIHSHTHIHVTCCRYNGAIFPLQLAFCVVNSAHTGMCWSRDTQLTIFYIE